MSQKAHPISKPVWLPFATGCINTVQRRRFHPFVFETLEDSPVDELFGPPDPLPPMINLSDAWCAESCKLPAFSAKRPEQISSTLHLLAVLRLCSTFRDFQSAETLTLPAALTAIDVGHPDWIVPVTDAIKDLLPDHTISTTADGKRGTDLLLLAPYHGDNLGNAKDAAKFAKIVREALASETPILLITAGHRALPESLTRIIPPSIRLAPIDADIVLAMLHLRFEDGDVRRHPSFRTMLPDPDMLARLGLDALHAGFRSVDGASIIQTFAEQAAALIQKNGPTLEQMSEDSEAVTTARKMISDLKSWSDGRLQWADCLHSMLFFGKPGTGKTFVARAMGRSSGLPVITASFASWQSRGHLGDLLRAMQETFAEATAAAPCILFIDEIDAAGSRESNDRNNSSYRRQVINGFIEQVDFAIRAEGVLIIGACNDIEALDPAILRPGRFDRLVEVRVPGRDALTAMLQQQLQGEVQEAALNELVTAAIGSTPAVIDAAIRSARSDARSVGRPIKISDVVKLLNGGGAVNRALMWRIAIHECGHAIFAVERVLGDVCHVRLGSRDGDIKLIPELGAGLIRDHSNMLAYTLAGRAAESLIFGSIGGGSGGPAQTCDLAHANRIALAMETSYGFGADGLIWSSSHLSDRIDDPVLRASVRTRLDAAVGDAKRVLAWHQILLLEMAKDLMRNRILEGTDLQIWIERIKGHVPWDPDDPSGRRQAAEVGPMCKIEGQIIDLRPYRMDRC